MKKLIAFSSMLVFFGIILYFVSPKNYTKNFSNEIDAKKYIEMHPNYISTAIINYDSTVYTVKYRK